MMTTTIAATVSQFPTTTLRHVLGTLNAEIVADGQRGVRGTQQHAGKLELITAITAELATRSRTAVC